MSGKTLLKDVPEGNRLPGWPDRKGGMGGGPVFAYIYTPAFGGAVSKFRPTVFGGPPLSKEEPWLGTIDTCGPSTSDVPMLADGTFDWESIPPAYPKNYWQKARWSFSGIDLIKYL